MKDLGIGFIASASGRFYAMDRDNNWDRMKKAEGALFECKGNICEERKPSEIVKELYKKGVFDEHIEPIVFLDETNLADLVFMIVPSSVIPTAFNNWCFDKTRNIESVVFKEARIFDGQEGIDRGLRQHLVGDVFTNLIPDVGNQNPIFIIDLGAVLGFEVSRVQLRRIRHNGGDVINTPRCDDHGHDQENQNE